MEAGSYCQFLAAWTSLPISFLGQRLEIVAWLPSSLIYRHLERKAKS